jgi:hypothetical protein
MAAELSTGALSDVSNSKVVKKYRWLSGFNNMELHKKRREE